MIAKVKAGIKNLLPKNTFARGVSILVGGTAGAQLLAVLAAPILTRLYSPEDFGLLAVYASLLGLIGVVASLRYGLAIPLPQSDEEAAHLLVLSLLIVLGMTVLAAIAMAVFGSSIANALGVPALTDYLWLLPLGVLLGGVYSVFNYWAVRTKSFTTIAGTKIRQAVVSIVIQLTAFKLGGIALLFAQVAGQSVGTTTLILPALKRNIFAGVNRMGILKCFSRYKKIGFFSSLSGLLNTASTQIPVLILITLFNPAAAGFYSLANRVLAVPMSLIGGAIGEVVFGGISDAVRENKTSVFLSGVSRALIWIGALPALILILFAPELFRIVFGAEWRIAGEFVSWMAIWFYFQFISSPLSTIVTALDHEDVAFYWNGSLLALRSGALFYGATHTDLLGTIKIFSLISAAGYVIYLAWICRLAGMGIFGKFRETAISGSFALLCLAPALYLKSLSEGGSLVTVFIIFLGLVGALVYSWLAIKVIKSRVEST